MKKIIFFSFLLVFSKLSYAQAINPDFILGTWINDEKNLIVNCYKQNNKYFAKVIWYKAYRKGEPIDANGQQSSLWMNAVIMKNFVFDTDEWNHGTVTDLESGDSYSAYISQGEKNTLEITGYVWIRLFSESSKFLKYTAAYLPNGDPVPN